MSSGTSTKRKTFSLEAKSVISEAISSGAKKKDVTARFGIPQSSLSRILKAKDAILDSLKKDVNARRKRLKAST